MKKLDPARVAALPPSKVLHPEAEQPKIEHDEDLIPQIELPSYPEDPRIAELRNKPIEDVYGDFGLKIGRKTRQGHMAQCPDPTHGGDGDTKPSGSTDTSRNIWCCHACGKRTGKFVGGDILELGAWMLPGFDPDTYRSKENFPRLIDALSDYYGLANYERAVVPLQEGPGLEGGSLERQVTESENGKAAGQAGNLVSPGSSLVKSEPTVLPGLHLVEEEPDETDEEPEEFGFSVPGIPEIPWKKLFPPDSFMDIWMRVTDESSLPENFYGFLGLQGVSVAVGRNAYWYLSEDDLFPNLYIVLYGPVGQGKSRATNKLMTLLRAALPHDRKDPEDTGCFMSPFPGSREILIQNMSRPIYDAVDPKKIADWAGARGFLDCGEFAVIMNKGHSQGQNIKPCLQDFYDCKEVIDTDSRTAGYYCAKEAFLSVVATTQPKAIRSVLLPADADSGFASRWIYVIGQSKPKRPYPPRIDLTSCILPLQKIKEWTDLLPRPISLSPAASDTYQEFFFEKITTLEKRDDNLSTRLEATILKTITLFACNAMEQEVQNDTLEAALSFYEYYDSTYHFLGEDLGTGERQEMYDHILKVAMKICKETKKPAKYSDIHRYVKRQYKDAGILRRALDDLGALGLLGETTVRGARGPATKGYAPASPNVTR